MPPDDTPSRENGAPNSDLDKSQHLIVPNDPASISYVKGLVERGEAVSLAPGENLPPGATHEIVGETQAGIPIVKRRRFSAY
jgi:hypothetical protein